jgi:hypothetical protein
MKLLAIVLLLFLFCTPQTWTVISEKPDRYLGQYLPDCYEILRVTPIYYTSGTAYRITFRDLPKRKQHPPTYEESLKDTNNY